MRKQPSWIFTLLLVGVNLANLHWHSTAIGLTFGLAYLLWCGFLAGGWMTPHARRRWQLYWGLITHLALTSIAGTAIYWLYQLNDLSLAFLMLALPIPWLLLPHYLSRQATPLWSRDQLYGIPRTLGINMILLIAFLAAEFFNLRWIVRAATTEAIRTPWQVIPPQLFVGYCIATVAFLALILRSDRAGKKFVLGLLHVAVSVSVALLVYPLGFGFDSIIHQATEGQIVRFGQIFPKPPYYLGQYALVVFLTQLLGLSVTTIDRLIAPFGFVLFAMGAYFPWRRSHPFAAALPLVTLLLPYGQYAVTTPQAVGNLWVLYTALAVTLPFLSSGAPTRLRWLPFVLATATAATVTHPIAGVPAFTLVCLAAVNFAIVRRTVLVRFARTASLFFLTLGAIAALPLLFLLQARLSGYAIHDALQFSNIFERTGSAAASLLPLMGKPLLPLLDFTYGLDRFRPALLIILALGGIMALTQRRVSMGAIPPLLTAGAMLLSAGVLQLYFRFPQLPPSEQTVFPSRVVEMAWLTLLPLVLAGVMALLLRIEKDGVLRLTALTLAAACFTATFYLAYPRVDAYHVDRGYNMSAADIAAVHAVADDAKGNAYLVLANQMTSVAAVREFGFTPSYPAADGSGKNYYFYPIPTGEPLYQSYLTMVYQRPSLGATQDAAKLVTADIRTVYFILDRYWDNFDVIAAEAKMTANRWWEIADGRALVFRYDTN
ncbi:MAG: hypothetical protein PHI63_03165 [Patescibacteria group bacterium]|nr:hypothetical protein [Patescibacteria group bacterium]